MMKSLLSLCLFGAAIAGFGDCPDYDPPQETNKCCPCPVGIILDASFLYWLGGEEGLTVATGGVLNTGVLHYAQNLETVLQSFDYHPGFKLGFGVVIEREWSIHSEYTWLRGENTVSRGAPTDSTTAGVASIIAATGTPVWAVSDWFLQGTNFTQALSGTRVTSKWEYGVDLLDVMARRPFTHGCWLIITPSMGLQAAFVRQSMNVDLTEEPGIFGFGLPLSAPSQPIHSTNHSNSWGIGPKVGVECNCMMPQGFRIRGDSSLSLLYTSYTKIDHSEDPASTAFNSGSLTTSFDGYSCLRPIGKLGLGAGWGRYIYCQQFHIDFLASYDFTIFWEQNMMRKLLDDVLTGTSSGPTDLYFHGLTLTGRFDF